MAKMSSSTPAPAERERLKQMLDARAETLGMTWREIAERAGYSEPLIRRVRNDWNRAISPEVARALDRAMSWVEGEGIMRILAGEHPIEADDAEATAGSEMDILQYWSRALDGPQFQKLFEHISIIRKAAFEEGKRAARRPPPAR